MSAVQWFEFISSLTLQVSLVVAVAAGLDRWCAAAATKVTLWNACFLSILGVMLMGLLMPRLRLFHPWSSLKPESLLTVAQVESTLATTFLTVGTIGTTVMLLRWLWQFVVMQRFLSCCQPVSASQAQQIVDSVPADMLTIAGKTVQFRIGSEGFGPFCYQLHQPYIVLPASVFDHDSEVLGPVLHHELTHLTTQHPLQLFCQRLVQCLLWFHPLIWASCRRASLVREFVCDDVSAQNSPSPTSYLRALVTIAEQTLRHQQGTLAITRSKQELLIRVRRLTEAAPPEPKAKRLAAIGLLAALSLIWSQLWLPTDPLSSDRTSWSPWPSWSAEAIHVMNVSVRDYEPFEPSHQLHEWIEASSNAGEPHVTR